MPEMRQEVAYAELVKKFEKVGMAWDEPRIVKKYIDVGNARTDMPTPEKELWMACLVQATEEALGQVQWSDTKCAQCHNDDIHCGCFTMEIDPAHIRANPRRGKLYVTKPVYFEGGEGCFIQAANGRNYARRAIDAQCKKPYPHKNCAMAWIMSDDKGERTFRWVCEILNIEPDYYRRLLGVK